MENTKVGIIGLGLMGGSLSIALRESSPSYHIIGMDHNPIHCKEAMERNNFV